MDETLEKLNPSRRWYYANREELCAKRRARYAANREKILNANRAYRQANIDAYRESARKSVRKYRKENAEKVLATNAKYRQANPEWAYITRRNNHLKTKFGLTHEQWEAMFEAQGCRCANTGCGSPDPRHKYGWATDHCHTTGKVRAILCQPCNMALGGTRDNTAALRGLADYLERHQQRDPTETLTA